jgi:hemolysin III
MTERIERAAESAQRRAVAAQEAVAERVGAAQDAAARGVETVREQAADMREQAAEVVAKVKPRLRGVIHEYAFFAAIALGALLVLRANTDRQVVATTIYAAGICGLFGISALYHRVNWRRPRARAWMRRLDHSMIFVFIAASFTPFALLVLHGSRATTMLIIAWGLALAGVVMSLVWVGAPKWLTASVYVILGMLGAVLAPEIWSGLGWLAFAGIAFGGALYATGAVIYATERPNPAPAVFGYHEVFHTLVTGAAATHYAVIAFLLIPLTT